jgi:hypothetical protein
MVLTSVYIALREPPVPSSLIGYVLRETLPGAGGQLSHTSSGPG